MNKSDEKYIEEMAIKDGWSTLFIPAYFNQNGEWHWFRNGGRGFIVAPSKKVAYEMAALLLGIKIKKSRKK